MIASTATRPPRSPGRSTCSSSSASPPACGSWRCSGAHELTVAEIVGRDAARAVERLHAPRQAARGRPRPRPQGRRVHVLRRERRRDARLRRRRCGSSCGARCATPCSRPTAAAPTGSCGRAGRAAGWPDAVAGEMERHWSPGPHVGVARPGPAGAGPAGRRRRHRVGRRHGRRSSSPRGPAAGRASTGASGCSPRRARGCVARRRCGLRMADAQRLPYRSVASTRR